MGILRPEIQKFIRENLQTNLVSLRLKKSPFEAVAITDIIDQINGWKVAEKKFPFLLQEGIIFPPNLNLEQASSEATANYKSSLTKGKSMADLTAGFGIDAYYISKKFEEVTLVEQNPDLLKIVAHNWQILDKNAQFIHQNLEKFLTENRQIFDLVFLDPARRDRAQKKVFLLEDLSPNILDILPQIKVLAHEIIIKLSPLLDISYVLSVLENVEAIHIVAVRNEVKELLVHLKRNHFSPTKIHAVNLESAEPDFIFDWDAFKANQAEFSDPLNFIYIPNNALLKTGAFHLIAHKFGLKKLHPNTHLYTSAERINDFPGRVFQMKVVSTKTLRKGDQYNIISKNYPLKPEEIKKKYGLKDGGKDYLIFTQSMSGKTILKSVFAKEPK